MIDPFQKMYELTTKTAISELESEVKATDLKKSDAAKIAIMTIYNFEYQYYKTKSTPQIGEIYELTHQINRIKNENFVSYPVKFIGRISSISDSTRSIIDDIPVTVFNFTLSYNNDEINVLSLPYDYYWGTMQRVYKSGQPALFFGTIIPYSKDNIKGYSFYFKQFQSEVTMYDLLTDRDYIMEQLKKKVEYYSNVTQNGIRGYIKETLINEIGIKGLDYAKDLEKAIDFMILQSLSRGRSTDGRYSNKLHSLVIGAPASGKKLLTMIASILNPVNYEVSPSASKVTAAGLVGNVTRDKNGKITSNPGYLPLATHGVLCIQDFHEISRNDNQLWGIFSQVMEDGVVMDSTSAKTKHDAITSLHIDMNKISQVNLSSSVNKFTDINIPMNILSRFDFIIDIPPDVDRQFQIALDMIGDEKILGTSIYEFHDSDWKIKLRRMIAYLSSTYHSANRNKIVSKYFRNKFQELIDQNKQYRNYQTNLPSMITRLENSIDKLVKAIACAEMTEQITKEHIDEAFDFISYKLEFLKNYEFIEVPPNYRITKKVKLQKRRDDILIALAGKTLPKQEIYQELRKVLDSELTTKTIDRDLSTLEAENKVIHNKHGEWEFPNIENEENIPN